MVPEAAPRHKRLATRDTRSLTLPRTTVALSKWAAICRWSSAKPGKALTCQRHWQIAPWNCDHYLSSNSQLFLWGVASSGSLKCIPSSSDPLASFDSSPAQGTFQGFFELACPQFILWNSIDFFMDLNAVWPWIPEDSHHISCALRTLRCYDSPTMAMRLCLLHQILPPLILVITSKRTSWTFQQSRELVRLV